MKYWIDVENGEYGFLENSESFPGLEISAESVERAILTERMATRAREVGGVLVMEAMETFQAVFGALESALAMRFIYSPVAPTCAAPPVKESNVEVLPRAEKPVRTATEAIAA